jgi:hypothetical protein
MAEVGDRYDTRRTLVLQSANTIGTAWLRGGMLPDAHAQPVRELLREYVELHVRAHDPLRDPAVMTAARRRSAEIQSALWQHAEASAREACNERRGIISVSQQPLVDVQESIQSVSRDGHRRSGR